MSTTMSAPRLFTLVTRFYLDRLNVAPSGNFAAAVEGGLRSPDLNLGTVSVRSARAIIGDVFGAGRRPVQLEVSFVASNRPEVIEALKGVIRGFMRSHQLSWSDSMFDVGMPSAVLHEGGVILDSRSARRTVGPVTYDNDTLTDVAVPSAPSAPVTSSTSHVDPVTRETVVTTVTPRPGTNTATKTVVRTNPTTRQSSTTTAIIPSGGASDEPPARTSRITVPMALGVLAAGGIAYYFWLESQKRPSSSRRTGR